MPIPRTEDLPGLFERQLRSYLLGHCTPFRQTINHKVGHPHKSMVGAAPQSSQRLLPVLDVCLERRNVKQKAAVLVPRAQVLKTSNNNVLHVSTGRENFSRKLRLAI